MDGGPPSTQTDTREMLQSLAQYGPAAIRAITDVAPYVAQSEQNINKNIAPQQAALETQIYGDYGPKINDIGNIINRQNQLAASQTEADLAGGPGRTLVNEADTLQRQLDPEYYANRAIIGQAVDKLLGSMSPSTLTPTELEQINRGISARQGAIPDSALSTIRNAQTFGSALQQKQSNFGNAINVASSALPGLKSGMSGFEIATQRPLYTNSGNQRLSNPSVINPTSAMDQNFGFANNILSNIGASQRVGIQKQKDAFDMANSASSTLGNVVGSVASAF